MTAENLALVFGPNILSPEVRTFQNEQVRVLLQTPKLTPRPPIDSSYFSRMGYPV